MRFPNTEAKIGKLARFMIGGLRSQQDIFPALGGGRPKAASMHYHGRGNGTRGIAKPILDILVLAWNFDFDLPLDGRCGICGRQCAPGSLPKEAEGFC